MRAWIIYIKISYIIKHAQHHIHHSTNKNILWQEFGSGELLLIHSPFSLQLTQGTLVTVPPSLVKRCKNHFHNMLCGASIILGNNGYIWISPIVSDDHQQPQYRFQTPTGVSSVEKEEKVSTSKFIILVFSLDTMSQTFVAQFFSMVTNLVLWPLT